MKNPYYSLRSLCRICGSADLYQFLDLGMHPLSDAFVSADQLKNEKEFYFPLSIYVCNKCNLMQLLDVVHPRLLFSENYALFSSASPALVPHFKSYALEIEKIFGHEEKKFVIEIASNDGALLAPLKELGFAVLGVEPATNVAEVCRSKGIEVFGDFFSKALSLELKKKYGYADIIIANNVLAHVDDPLDFMRGIKNILHDKGVFVCEFQYGLDLIKNTEFDNIYHEHVSYLTVRPLSVLMEECGMKIIDIRPNTMQGGSLRCYVVHKENTAFPVTEMVVKMSQMEVREGLDNKETYHSFATRVMEIRENLLAVIKDAKAHKKRIVCYGAPAKGNTLLNFCGIGPDLIDYCIERTAFKINKFTPGMHISIVSEKTAEKDGKPDFYLLLIWNYLDAVLAKEKKYLEGGGKFIVPIPSVRVI